MTISVNKNEHMLEQRYRPQSIDEMILPEKDKKMFDRIIKSNKIPHMVLHSTSPGTGKTTIAKVLCETLGLDYMFVNGADMTLGKIRNEFVPFASSGSFNGRKKVILVDEGDRKDLVESQKYLRSFMESYSDNCSIIITANDVNAFIEPLLSRCQIVKFGDPTEDDKKRMQVEMVKRCFAICESEGIEIQDRKAIGLLVKNNFPDFRKTVMSIDQYYSKHGVINVGVVDEILNNRTGLDEVIEALKTKNIKELRALSTKHTHDFAGLVNELSVSLYPMLTGASIIRMYEIVGQSNQMYGMAASAELHINYMLVQLAVEMVWK